MSWLEETKSQYYIDSIWEAWADIAAKVGWLVLYRVLVALCKIYSAAKQLVQQ